MRMLPFKRRTPAIPLDRDATGRYLPYIIASLTLLATLMLVLAQGLTGALGGWRSGLEGRATVQILPLDTSAPSLPDRVALALSMLQASPLVSAAHEVSPDRMQQLLAPWLGQGALPEDLPVPALIDVELADPGADLTPVREALSVVAGAQLDDHGSWLRDVRHLAQTGAGLALLMLAFILGATTLMLVLLVRAGLSTHRDVIELLHLVGATDAFIVRQFRRHMLALAAQGAVLGLLLAVLVILLLTGKAARAGFSLQTDWRWLPVVPVLFVALAGYTAQRVTRRRLAELP